MLLYYLTGGLQQPHEGISNNHNDGQYLVRAYHPGQPASEAHGLNHLYTISTSAFYE